LTIGASENLAEREQKSPNGTRADENKGKTHKADEGKMLSSAKVLFSTSFWSGASEERIYAKRLGQYSGNLSQN